MVTKNTNPFVLPGFGQSGDMATNPLLASMEMMRKAWENLATGGGLDTPMTIPGVAPGDLERRIADLRVVENWLRMNLSMLGSTIQALEVQRSTLATLQAFMASAGGTDADPAQASPLDVALGIRRGQDAAPSADTSGLFGDKPASPPGASGASTGASESAPGATDAASDTGTAQTMSEPMNAVMKSWWDMLQAQFDNLADATSVTFQGAEAMKEAASAAQEKAVESTRAAAETLTASMAGGAAKKTTAKKTAAKKTAAKKTAAKKVAGKTAARTTTAAAKKTTARKAAAKKAATKTASTRNKA